MAPQSRHMMESTLPAIEGLKIPILKGRSDYRPWCMKMRSILSSRSRLHWDITRGVKLNGEFTLRNYNLELDTEEQALCILFQGLEGDLFDLVFHCETPSEVWKTLSHLLSTRGDEGPDHMELMETKQNGRSMDDFIFDVLAKKNKLDDRGSYIHAEEIRQVFFEGVDEKHKSSLQHLESSFKTSLESHIDYTEKRYEAALLAGTYDGVTDPYFEKYGPMTRYRQVPLNIDVKAAEQKVIDLLVDKLREIERWPLTSDDGDVTEQQQTQEEGQSASEQVREGLDTGTARQRKRRRRSSRAV